MEFPVQIPAPVPSVAAAAAPAPGAKNGMLIDCSFAQLKKPFVEHAALGSLLPKTVTADKIRGLKIAKQPLKNLAGLPLCLTLLNVSGCGLKNLDGIELCATLKL
jgi:hypothetical protein